MCGICGMASAQSSGLVDGSILREMCQVIYHRGPDEDGFYQDEMVGLGMRRLSIIDLVTGQQPVTNEDKTIWLVFNGEIYNYLTLHDELVARGHRFVTKSDTEVIVHAYEEYGDRCPEYFNGMFAFALWDAPRRRLFIARDHLGIKPLYYWHSKGQLVFGSELKAVVAHPAVPRVVDPVALDSFLTIEYIPAPRTIFKDIYKLPAGHQLVFENGQVNVDKYWDVQPIETPHSVGEAAEALEYLIDDAVRMQLMSDVPLGAFLSGGIDSSTVVSAMCKASATPVKTFSVGFDDASYNELPYARAVARQYKTDHHEEILQPDVAATTERLLHHLDEPFGDFSIFPTYLVSEMARRKVKVVLSGDGGDEIFGGYDTYVAQGMDRYYRLLPAPVRRRYLPAIVDLVPPQPAKKGAINKVKRFVEGASLPDALQHTRWMWFMSDAEKTRLYQPDLKASLNGDTIEETFLRYFRAAQGLNELARQQYVDVKTYLVDDILVKVDRMSMAVSLEARVPLLDYRIVELAVNLPAHMKLNRGQTKRILRKAMGDRLPVEVLNKPKQGFSIPLKNWLRGPIRPMMTDLLAPDLVRKRGYFEPDTVTKWVSEHLAGTANHSHRIWALMVFEIWHENMLG